MATEIITERLLLQPVTPADQAFIFQGLSHPQVVQFYGVRYDSFASTAAQMKWYRTLEEEGTGFSWLIGNRQTGEKMGNICIYAYKPEHQKAEVGFWLLPAFGKKGYALEALLAAMASWPLQKKLHRLEAFVEVGNTDSARLLQKAGFVYEGTMVDCEKKNDKFISLQIYARLLG